jgi:hypothetical protein
MLDVFDKFNIDFLSILKPKLPFIIPRLELIYEAFIITFIVLVINYNSK